ncbi:MAG: adenosylcobinamide-GDP ribazoletransferase [Candidatus Magnetomorum sp.]|nr:adenosylcobinamide-GDP ribazoletransferase [Candidatus Magnetomorum sp.]
MNGIKKEWLIFKHAIVFFTRISLKTSFHYHADDASKAIRYLPFIGGIAGIWAALVFSLCMLIFPMEIAVFLSMLSTILLTGALHEDGFADFCDSLGGMTVEKRLAIMKDSNMGAYGVIGLMGILLGKYLFLVHIPAAHLPAVLISAHVMSRLSIMFLMLFLPYVGKKESSKSLTLVDNNHTINVCIACVITGLFVSGLPFYSLFSIPIITLVIVCLFQFYKKSLGGYTGDYLGAAQQLTELAHYLSMVYYLSL